MERAKVSASMWSPCGLYLAPYLVVWVYLFAVSGMGAMMSYAMNPGPNGYAKGLAACISGPNAAAYHANAGKASLCAFDHHAMDASKCPAAIKYCGMQRSEYAEARAQIVAMLYMGWLFSKCVLLLLCSRCSPCSRCSWCSWCS